MASAALKTISENHLQCSICQDRYTKPKALDCLHSFCEKCLVDYYTDSKQMPCPVCQRETKLPQKGVTGLKTNFYLEILLTKTPEDESSCQRHKGEINRFYCIKCEKLICGNCTTIDHPKPEHHYIDYDTAALERRQLMKDVFPEFKREIKTLQHSLAVSSQAKQEFGKKVTGIMTEVHDKAAKIIAKVKREENRMITEIKALERDRNTRFDEHEKTVSIMVQKKQYSLEVAEDVTKNSSDSNFLELYSDIKLLTGQTVPQIDRSLSCLRFKQSNDDEDINLGKLELEGKWEVFRKFGKFGYAANIAAVAPPNDLAVADYKSREVKLFSSEGHLKNIIPIQCNPHGIAATHNHIVVVDYTNNVIKMYNHDGTPAFDFHTVPHSEVGNTAVDLWSVAVNNTGNIIVGDVKRMVVSEHSSTDGSLIHTRQVKTAPCFLAIDNNNRVVVSSGYQHKVDIVDGNSTSLLTIKPTINGQEVQHCTGICCDGSGIYIAVCNGFNTGHIHHYDNDGTFLSCIDQSLYNPTGITFTADGNQLVVADCQSVKIYHMV